MSLRLLLLLECFPSLLNLIMSRESRLCPGMRGRKCGAFLSLLDRDPYPTCTRCRGKSCTKDLTCDFCIGWSSSQWEAFAKTQTYKERKLSRPSGFLPPATKTSPRAGTSSEVLHPEASSSSRDAPCAASREAFSTPARPRCSERGGSVSGRSSGARELAPVSSAPSGVEEGGAAPCRRCFLGGLSPLIIARSATW